jgi:hypothetical protein
MNIDGIPIKAKELKCIPATVIPCNWNKINYDDGFWPTATNAFGCNYS